MEFTHNEALSRYEAWDESELVGEAHYVQANGVADFDHTRVPAQFEGRGIASKLVRHAMDEIRASGEVTVKPTCPYVVRWFELHPDYADVLAAEWFHVDLNTEGGAGRLGEDHTP